MSGFSNNQGTTQQAFSIGGPLGPSLQSDSQGLNLLAANGILAPLRVGWAVGPSDAVSLYQLGLMLTPPPFVFDPSAALIAPV